MAELPEISVAGALEALRGELEAAWRAGQARPVRFRASGVTVTFEAVARADRDGTGKIRWWLVEAGGGAKVGQERKQTVTLTLTPLLDDGSGSTVPLEVDADQPTPGR